MKETNSTKKLLRELYEASEDGAIVLADIDSVKDGWLISQLAENPPNIFIKKKTAEIVKEFSQALGIMITKTVDEEIENFTIGIIIIENKP